MGAANLRPWASARSFRRLLLIGYYLWLPLVYLVVYIPLIVPRLASWPRIPVVVLLLTLGPYIVLCVAVGVVLDHRRIALNGVLAAVVIQCGEVIGGQLHAPGMGENWAETDPVFFWLALLPMKVLVLVGLAEAGHLVFGIMRKSA